MKRVLAFLFAVSATLWMAAPAAAWLNDSTEPGSVLVFHKFETGTVTTIDQGPLPVIEFRVSVVCPTNVDCSSLPSPTPVTIMGHWVCKGDFTTHVCGDFNFEVQTTVSGTIVFDPQNTLFGLGATGAVQINPPACDEGYLIMWVESGRGGVPIKADLLVGTAVIHDSDNHNGDPSFDARAFNAIPIQANPDLLFGSPIPLNSDGSLPFDGSGYQAVTGKVYGNVRYDQGDSKTELAFLTLDVVGGQQNTPTDVFLNFYNENEMVASISNFQFTCWDDEALSGFGTLDDTFGRQGVVASPQFSPGAQQGTKPVTLMVIAETEESYSQPISITGALTGPVTVTGNGSLTGTATATATSLALFVTKFCIVDTTGSPKCTIPSTLMGPVTVSGLATIPGTLTSTLGLQRSYTYPLLNDSVPLPTSFLPH